MKRLTALVFTVVTVATMGFNVLAQKLPGVQKNRLYAPANLKVDGKANEWKNTFEAYNHATDIFYSIANDDSNVYLVVQATSMHAIEKILAGGITFTIKNADKKNKAVATAVTYLFVPTIDRFSMLKKLKGQDEPVPYNQAEINQQFAAAAKEIQVAGISGTTDTLLSVYNEAGIRAAALFDVKKALTYELSIPIKYVQKGLNTASSFSYNIKLSAEHITPHIAGANMVVSVSSVRRDTKAADDMQDLFSATDFSGTYVLAGK